MAVKIAPSMRQQFEDSSGNPYAGAKLFTYAAGSSTKQATYTDSTGLSANTNPIILDAAGRTPFGLWLTAGLTYKFVLALSTDTDPPSSPIFTEDVVSGVNDTATSTSQWIASGVTPTYISGTQFTLVGDKTADFHVGRRLKFTVTAGTVYGLITVSAYTSLTTVTVVMDSGALDTGLSAVELSILSSTGSALPGRLRTLADLSAQQATDIAALSAYAGTLLNDADASAAQTTLGISTYAKTILDDTTASAARTTLGVFSTLIRITRFTSAGSGTWTKPADTVNVLIKAVGGGGGGGGGFNASFGGGGGGSGGYAESDVIASATSYAYTVGAAGTAGAGGANGGAGGNTTIAGIVATGGGGGLSGAGGGVGGLPTGGFINVRGSGGAAAGPSALGGAGGSSFYGGGGDCNGSVGGAGSLGGGGGGGVGPSTAGGAGGAGYIEIWEFA